MDTIKDFDYNTLRQDLRSNLTLSDILRLSAQTRDSSTISLSINYDGIRYDLELDPGKVERPEILYPKDEQVSDDKRDIPDTLKDALKDIIADRLVPGNTMQMIFAYKAAGANTIPFESIGEIVNYAYGNKLTQVNETFANDPIFADRDQTSAFLDWREGYAAFFSEVIRRRGVEFKDYVLARLTEAPYDLTPGEAVMVVSENLLDLEHTFIGMCEIALQGYASQHYTNVPKMDSDLLLYGLLTEDHGREIPVFCHEH